MTLLHRITAANSATVTRVIRQTSTEYGLTTDKGYTVVNPDLNELYELYSQSGSAYWVMEKEGEVVGGDDVASLVCSESDICGLQKMYSMISARGQGLAKKLALLALDYARERGLKRCYLETTAFLTEAIGLYEHLGFGHTDGPLGCTDHADYEVRILGTLWRLDIAGVPGNITPTGAMVRQPD